MTRNDKENGGGADAKANRPGAPVDPFRIYRMAWRGRFWLIGAVVLGLVGGVVFGMFGIKPSYLASATIRFEPQSDELRRAQLAEITTFLESMSSEPAVQKFRERMKLPKHVDPTTWFVTDPDVYGGLITVSAAGDTPKLAAKTVNEMLTATMEYRRELAQAGLQIRVESLEERLETARKRLDEARAAYDDFREEKGISDLSAEQQEVIGAAATARAAADVAEATRQSLEERLATLREEFAAAPGRSSDDGPVASGSEINRLRGELNRLRRSLSEQHPQVRALKAQLERLESNSGGPRASIGREIARLERELNDAKVEAERLQRAAAVSRERATAASQVEGEASALLAAVRVEEQLVSDLDTERAKVRNNLTRARDDFRVLSPAVPPTRPESNKLKIIAMIGFPLLAAILGLVALAARELWGFRVRTASEVGFWGGGPVIGATTWPRDPHGLDGLIADLDDHLPKASGSMLVVGATDAEIPLVEQLSSLLNEDWFSPGLVDLEQPAAVGALQQIEETGRYAMLGTGGGSGGGSTALARPDSSARPLAFAPQPGHSGPASAMPQATVSTEAWTDAPRGQGLRRAARLADRVLVVVAAARTSMADVAATTTRLGRTDGVGYLVVDIEEEFAALPDRIGDVEGFFAATRD